MLKIVLVRCMVYYHTEDEWEQTMEVMFIEKKSGDALVHCTLYTVLWGWVSLMWAVIKFLP